MPKLVIAGQETEKKVVISLEQDSDGDVFLKFNDFPVLVIFATEGTVSRHQDVSSQLGFDVDSKGRLVIGN